MAEQALEKKYNIQAKPILKWAGGKTQMLKDLLPKVPASYGRYIEPFIGGGAMFFALNPNDAIIADNNNTFNIKGWEQSIQIAYKTNMACDVIIPEEAQSWISIVPKTRALVNESVTLNIASNNAGPERSAVVKVVAANNNESFAEYTITQAQRYYIEYTSTDGSTIIPYSSYAFGATIIRNEYTDGKGYIDFDAPVTSIGERAFYECTSLTSITIPDSVTWIGYNAFSGCSSLASITIPDSVTAIGSGAFCGCGGELIITSKIVEENYTLSNYPQQNGWLSGAKFTKLTIGDSVTSIGDYAFRNCSSLTSITIPDSVTEIGNYAFRNCTSLTSITIPDSVTSIGKEVFYGCASLTSITIPDSVTEIGYEAFWFCTSLTSITIPDSVTSIGSSAFRDCTSLKKITIPTSVDSIDTYAFEGNSALDTVIIASHKIYLGGKAFDNCDSLKAVYILSDSVPDCMISQQQRPFLTGTPRTPAPRGTLYVPIGCKDKYPERITMDFAEVVEMDMTALRQATGIATPAIDDASVAIGVENGKIIISGCNEGETISIYSMDGKLLKHTTADNNEEELSIDNLSGTIVVRIGAKAYKVKL